MANTTELKERINLFLNGGINYAINKGYCMATMSMMLEYIEETEKKLEEMRKE